MANPTSRLLVSLEGSHACVRVCGRACFSISSDFKRLVHGLHETGVRTFVLELSECTIMDSTFLGILARFARMLAEKGAAGDDLLLWNPPPRIVDLLDNLGVTQLFAVRHGKVLVLSTPERLVPGTTNKLEAARDALDAHQTLIELNPENAAKFKDVAEFMREDIRRLEKGNAAGPHGAGGPPPDPISGASGGPAGPEPKPGDGEDPAAAGA